MTDGKQELDRSSVLFYNSWHGIEGAQKGSYKVGDILIYTNGKPNTSLRSVFPQLNEFDKVDEKYREDFEQVVSRALISRQLEKDVKNAREIFAHLGSIEGSIEFGNNVLHDNSNLKKLTLLCCCSDGERVSEYFERRNRVEVIARCDCGATKEMGDILKKYLP